MSKHSYIIRITLPDTRDCMEPESNYIFNDMRYAYEKLIREEPNYPHIGEVNYSDDGSYCDVLSLEQQLFKFTSQFPTYSFNICYSIFDFRILMISNIRNMHVRQLGFEEMLQEISIQKSCDVVDVVASDSGDAKDIPESGQNYGPHDIRLRHEITSFINKSQFSFDYIK